MALEVGGKRGMTRALFSIWNFEGINPGLLRCHVVFGCFWHVLKSIQLPNGDHNGNNQNDLFLRRRFGKADRSDRGTQHHPAPGFARQIARCQRKTVFQHIVYNTQAGHRRRNFWLYLKSMAPTAPRHYITNIFCLRLWNFGAQRWLSHRVQFKSYGNHMETCFSSCFTVSVSLSLSLSLSRSLCPTPSVGVFYFTGGIWAGMNWAPQQEL